MRRLGLTAMLLSIALPGVARGQEARLAGRVPEPARAELETILAAARAGGLPLEPLVDRALEGAAKAAPGPLIVAAVARLRDELLQVRGAFGEAASVAELTAGASALRAGAKPEQLARLRRLRPGKPLTVAAAVLADLAAAGVPADTAVGAVLALARDAEDADYIAFRRNVQRDIELGASPAAALAVRIRGVTGSADETTQGGSSAPPPAPPRPKKP